VATALGVLLGFSAALAGLTAAVWFGVVVLTRYSSLAALAAAAAAPFLTAWLLHSTETTVVVALMCAVLIYRHKSNIGKLLAGTESRVGGKKR
jgi:glycerol-3-phosphate acyltransferase PlsY